MAIESKVATNALLIWLMIAVLVIVMQFAAKAGFTAPIRRIEALDAIDDMIGRATEMGGTVLMGSGASKLYQAGASETMMAFAVVRYVVERTAKLGTRVIAACGSPDHIPILEDTVQQAAMVAGNPDYYRGGGEIVRMIGGDYWSFITANLMLLRPESGENVKALIGFGASGGYSAAGPTIGMAANLAGVISLGGTANVHQIHNFVACFDYAVIGDEVYALSAYLTRDPREIGNIMGLDYAKVIIVLMLIVGALYAVATGGQPLFT
jgi:hypothetical protein